jgi:hypothetical protein
LRAGLRWSGVGCCRPFWILGPVGGRMLF